MNVIHLCYRATGRVVKLAAHCEAAGIRTQVICVENPLQHGFSTRRLIPRQSRFQLDNIDVLHVHTSMGPDIMFPWLMSHVVIDRTRTRVAWDANDLQPGEGKSIDADLRFAPCTAMADAMGGVYLPAPVHQTQYESVVCQRPFLARIPASCVILSGIAPSPWWRDYRPAVAELTSQHYNVFLLPADPIPDTIASEYIDLGAHILRSENSYWGMMRIMSDMQHAWVGAADPAKRIDGIMPNKVIECAQAGCHLLGLETGNRLSDAWFQPNMKEVYG